METGRNLFKKKKKKKGKEKTVFLNLFAGDDNVHWFFCLTLELDNETKNVTRRFFPFLLYFLSFFFLPQSLFLFFHSLNEDTNLI